MTREELISEVIKNLLESIKNFKEVINIADIEDEKTKKPISKLPLDEEVSVDYDYFNEATNEELEDWKGLIKHWNDQYEDMIKNMKR